MIESDIRLLILFLIGKGQTNGDIVKRFWADNSRRTFDTWQDLGDLKEKLVEMGEYERFSFYAQRRLDSIPGPSGNRRRFDDWLLNPAKFCILVVDYLKEK